MKILFTILTSVNLFAFNASLIVSGDSEHGNQITLSRLNAMTLGPSLGSWSTVTTTSSDIITTNFSFTHFVPVMINGIEYFGGSAALEFSTQEDGLLIYNLTDNNSRVTGVFGFEFDFPDGPDTDNRDLLIFTHVFGPPSEGAVFQLDGELDGTFFITAHSPTSGANGEIPVSTNTPYLCIMQENGFSNKISVYDTNITLVGAIELVYTSGNTNGVTQIELGNINDHGGDADGWLRFYNPVFIVGDHTIKYPVGIPVIKHVRASGGSDSNSGDSFAQAYATWNYALDNATNADNRIFIHPGIYSSVITPSRSGTPGDKIHIYATPNTVTNTVNIDWGNLSNIVVSNIHFDGQNTVDDGMTFGNANRIEFWNCTFTRFNQWYIYMPNGDSCSQCLIIDNDFLGNHITGSGFIALSGTNSIASHNRLSMANEDYFFFAGQYNMIRNNYGHSPDANSSAHVDFAQSGSGISTTVNNNFNRIKANYYRDSDVPGTDHHFSNVSNTTDSDAYSNYHFSYNVGINFGTGAHNHLDAGGMVTNSIFIHETYVGAQRIQVSEDVSIAIEFGGRAKNNIFVDQWGTSVSNAAVLSLGTGGVDDYNLYYDTTSSITFLSPAVDEVNGLFNENPDFVNSSLYNFLLLPGSPADNSAGPVTLVNNANGTGTTFNVDDPSYLFGDLPNLGQYNGVLAVGDTIVIGTDVRTIVSISGAAITVDSSFSWEDNDPIYIGSSTTPDRGAYPSDHIKLTTATINGTTITPNGDTMFVVEFWEGIARRIDNTSPFEFPHPPLSGDITYKAYAQYASTIPSITAGEPPPPPEQTIINLNAVRVNVGTIIQAQ